MSATIFGYFILYRGCETAIITNSNKNIFCSGIAGVLYCLMTAK